MIRHTAIRVCRSFYSAQPQLCIGNLTAPTKIALATAQPISDGENQTIFPSESPSALGNSPSPSFSIDWSVAFDGASAIPFTEKASNVLLAPVNSDDIEIKPDGLLYLPEIKYRRILNKAFGPGGWALIPRGPHHSIGRTLTREWALVISARFVSLARGEQDYYSPEGLVTASEGVKSNALMRCCKDIGIASELWDPVFIRRWKKENALEVWAMDIKTKQRKRVWRRKDEQLQYPYQES